MSSSPNTQPILMREPGILGSPVKLTSQVCLRDGTGGTPVIIYDPLVHGKGNGAIVEEIRAKPIGINAVSVLYLFLRKSTDTSAVWMFFEEVALPAVTAIPTNAVLTGGYTALIPLPKILSPISTDATTPHTALRLNGSDYQWGVALGTAIVGGVNVMMLGGEY